MSNADLILNTNDKPKFMEMWPKSKWSNLALMAVVVIRYANIAIDFFLMWYWISKDETGRFVIDLVMLTFLCILTGWVSYFRQKHIEMNRDPQTSAVLGATQLQLFFELKDSLEGGKKTASLKILLNYGALIHSFPSALIHSYYGFSDASAGWFFFLFISVLASVINLGTTLVSVEKDRYIKAGLGKLPLFSTYSIILYFYRLFELASRVLSLMLFFAEYGGYFSLLVIVDLVFLRLIRYSTHQRIQVKKERSRKALSRSLNKLNKKVEDLGAIEEALQEDYTGVDDMTGIELIGYMAFWVFVYTPGIDAVPYVVLRMLENAGIVGAFVLTVDSKHWAADGKYEAVALVLVCMFMSIYLLYSAVWLYYRSHADFLHPKQDPEALELKIRKHLRDITPEHSEQSLEDVDLEASSTPTESQSGSDKHDEEAPKVQTGDGAAAAGELTADHDDEPAKTTARPALKKQPKRKKKSRKPKPPVELDDSDEEEAYPNNVITEVIVREIAVPVRAPPANRRTIGIQYDWNDHGEQETQDQQHQHQQSNGERLPANTTNAGNDESCAVM